MVQTAKDRLGADHVGLFAAMARLGLLVIAIGGRRVGNTRAQRHVRTSSIVMLDHHEYVQQTECGGDGDQEIAGNDSLCVQLQECRPAQVASWPAR